MFLTRKLLEGLNEAVIGHISKGEAPKTLGQFQQIFLCNVLSKLVSKVLANWLKPIMVKLTGKFQSRFIPGRSTIDNIVLAQEVLHSLRHNKGRKGGFVLKIYLEKAYDRIDWVFLGKYYILRGYNHVLIELIMDCVMSTKLTVA